MGAVEIRSDERGKLIPTGMAGIRQQIKTVTYRLFFATDLSGYNPATDLSRQMPATEFLQQITALTLQSGKFRGRWQGRRFG